MRQIGFFFIFLYFLLFVGCAIMRPPVVEVDEDQVAREAYIEGDYELALAAYEQLIEEKRNRQEEVDGVYLNHAGLSAFALGQTSVALDHLERARHTDAANDKTFAALALAYREVDNLSREITHLTNYLEKYPEGELVGAFQVRYFQTMAESRHYQEAYDTWPKLGAEAHDDAVNIHHYYEVNVALGHEEEADALAEAILRLDPDHVEAMDRLAKKYFNRAEKRYKEEMAAYDRNRTNRQYARLLEAFDELNKDFRTALGYFLKLYELNPGSEYASYLHNIYDRFNDDERARYYRRQIEQ